MIDREPIERRIEKRSATGGAGARLLGAAWGLMLAVATAGCTGRTSIEQLRQAMYDQPKVEPLEGSRFFADGRGSRQPVPGTVARGALRANRHFFEGRIDTALAATFPFEVTEADIRRGQERYEIFCTPCHDRAGTGRGMVVRRGFREPPSLHIERLRETPVGHFFDVMTNGYGAMYGYASRIPPRDRWAIAAYIRALQLSRRATLEDVPQNVRRRLEAERAR